MVVGRSKLVWSQRTPVCGAGSADSEGPDRVAEQTPHNFFEAATEYASPTGPEIEDPENTFERKLPRRHDFRISY